VSDERDGAGSPVDGDDSTVDGVDSVVDDIDSDGIDPVDDVGVDRAAGSRGQTAVATRPQRPSGKRSRREVTGAKPATDASPVKTDGDGKKPKTARKPGESRNPFTFVWNFLKQVVAELRKVIWPNRKQMISYTTVVLFFLAFMVALIGGVDLGLAKLVTLVFG
jgi:preprotein translocase subunit SecE